MIRANFTIRVFRVDEAAYSCKVQMAIKKALHEPRYASPDLRDPVGLRGHRLHFALRALTSTCAAARRVLDNEPLRGSSLHFGPGILDGQLPYTP